METFEEFDGKVEFIVAMIQIQGRLLVATNKGVWEEHRGIMRPILFQAATEDSHAGEERGAVQSDGGCGKREVDAGDPR
ncbi:MAG: hypothetical protein QNJ94_18535 [Alphaproteobacteria bacterium]|nr:hypothetical protein [Alphaproteobacteria bacterium]